MESILPYLLVPAIFLLVQLYKRAEDMRLQLEEIRQELQRLAQNASQPPRY